MPRRIRILSSHEAERIAAGEVVERPASVVRELVENALDAGARHVQVELTRGGLSRIRVADDGEGMSAQDASLALQRHATSKISSLGDLATLTTLGFRGEALPSVAAVSRLELLTAVDGAKEATRVVAKGGKVVQVVPAARSPGTTVTVTDLFYNTPARRKFLKGAASEFSRISESLLPEMLARPDVGFALQHDGRTAVNVSPASGLKERIAALWGSDFAERILAFGAESRTGSVHGYLSGPDDSRASRKNWHLFVNGRPVRDRLLSHAVAEGAGPALPRGRHPVVFLFLTLPASEVDVNVHPAKNEVHFAQAGQVHSLVLGALRGITRPASYIPTAPAPEARAVAEPSFFGKSVRPGLPSPPASSEPAGERFLERSPALEEDAPVVLAQYRDCFIVGHDASHLYLIDQHVAHERILYERLRRQMAAGTPMCQALLFPPTVDVGAGRGDAVETLLPRIRRCGLTAERFGPETFLVREAPEFLAQAQVERTFRDLVDLLASAGMEHGGDRRVAEQLDHRLAATVACHAAVKIHFSLTRTKMEFLVKNLFRCRDPLTCPHGRTTIVKWSHEQILRAFGRLY
ncbi:MAG: DNA mismatch repair endonuclease MutL [Acidobacteriota bacterium]